MSRQLPLVSLVLTTYNRAESFLPAALGSLLSQDYPRLELIALDDGSTDATPRVLERFRRENPDRMRWASHPNMGQVRTLNRGLEMAGGEFVGYLSDDDLLEPEAVSALVDVLSAEPEALGAYPAFGVIDEDDGVSQTVTPGFLDLEEMLRTNDTVVGPGALIRRSTLERVGLWSDAYRYVPDLDFWLRVALAGRMVRVEKRLAHARDHAETLTRSFTAEVVEERIRCIEGFLAREDVPPRFKRLRVAALAAAYTTAAVTFDFRASRGLILEGQLSARGKRFDLTARAPS